MQDEFYRNTKPDRYSHPVHISEILDDVTRAILDHIVMDNGNPPTPEQAKELKRSWFDEPQSGTDS